MRRFVPCLAAALLIASPVSALGLFSRHCPGCGLGPRFLPDDIAFPAPAAVWYGWATVETGNPPVAEPPWGLWGEARQQLLVPPDQEWAFWGTVAPGTPPVPVAPLPPDPGLFGHPTFPHP